MLNTPTAITTLVRPGPSTATIAIASRMPGNANRMSAIRIEMLSKRPPLKAQATPQNEPIAAPRVTALKPMPSE
jgi:hypothetical protein